MRNAERVQAILVAKKVLDDVAHDPDSDLSMMSRQFLRVEERRCELLRCLSDVHHTLLAHGHIDADTELHERILALLY